MIPHTLTHCIFSVLDCMLFLNFTFKATFQFDVYLLGHCLDCVADSGRLPQWEGGVSLTVPDLGKSPRPLHLNEQAAATVG